MAAAFVLGAGLITAPEAEARFKGKAGFKSGFHKGGFKSGFKGGAGFRRGGFRGGFRFNSFNRFNRFHHRGFNRFSRFNHHGFSRFNRGFNHNRVFFDRRLSSGFKGRFGKPVFVSTPATVVTRSDFIDDDRFLADQRIDGAFVTRRVNADDTPINAAYRVNETPARAVDGWSLLEAGEYQQARTYFARMASSHPRLAQPKVGFAVSAALLGDYDKAAFAFRRVEAVDDRAYERFALGETTRRAIADLLERDADKLPPRVDRALHRLLGASAPPVETAPATHPAGDYG